MEKTYCAAPWRGLHINFRGDVKTCCAGDPNMLGDLNSKSIDEILQSDTMKEIRATLQQGKMHEDYCYNCISAERYGRSERHWHNDVNPDFDSASASLEEHSPSIIDVRWNITCNLACNYCGPYCSSKWAAIAKGKEELLTIEQKHDGVKPYVQQVCEYVEEKKHSVREVALVGGEPLLLKENHYLLDVIPDDCIVTLITNTSVEFEKNAIVSKLMQRQKVSWSMSFDNVGDRFEYVRYGANWDLLDHNVRLINSWKDRGHWNGIHAVYNLYNCTRLRELRNYADSIGTKILWQTLYQPDYLDPTKHDLKTRELAIEEIDAYSRDYDLSDHEKSFFSLAKQNLSTIASDAEPLTERFKKHIHEMEHLFHKDRQTSFVNLWPELSHLC